MSTPADLFELVESMALAQPEATTDQPPPGIPSSELERILKWRATNRSVFNAKVQDGDVELSILGVIGASWFSDGISARSVKNFLDQNKDAKNIRVLMDTPGGDYFDGAAIMNQFKRHAARVTVEVIGEASSAGSVICMGADEIEMHAGSVMMVHRASSCMCGNGDDLRATASMLDKIDDALGNIYAARTGKPRDEIDELVKATTYMSAKEAVDKGFADREVAAKQKPKPAPGAARAQNQAPPAPAAEPQPEPTNAGPGAQLPLPNIEAEKPNMTIAKVILTALALNEDADEAAVVAAVNKLKTSARTGGSIEEFLGVSGAAALGAVKALKEGQEQTAELGQEVSKLKLVNAQRDFDALQSAGTKDKKLTPANAKRYSDKFAAALKLAEGEDGDADEAVAKTAEICEDLRGFLAIANRIPGSVPLTPPAAGSGSHSTDGAPMKHNDKAFEDMTPMARKQLKDVNPDLYNALREDAQARDAI